ncbi:gamma-type small acid-soluble spore protein [Lysinibacillus fusiformis]|uniref:gamma-type small acid-soluble spore protein n=1 Tax=Lysinibacillus fusiformis TaxID=28031 RepID=UPI00355837A4
MSKNRNKNQTADQIRQKIQQAEANKNQASGRFSNQNFMRSTEFGTETDADQVRQQIKIAETEYLQGASGPKANYGFGNNLN